MYVYFPVCETFLSLTGMPEWGNFSNRETIDVWVGSYKNAPSTNLFHLLKIGRKLPTKLHKLDLPSVLVQPFYLFDISMMGLEFLYQLCEMIVVYKIT